LLANHRPRKSFDEVENGLLEHLCTEKVEKAERRVLDEIVDFRRLEDGNEHRDKPPMVGRRQRDQDAVENWVKKTQRTV
jgi:hypothetical protein